MAEWFYKSNDEKIGPISTRDLKALAQNGEIGRDDLVWKEGLEEWVKAKKVTGLFSAETKTQPPPVPDSIPQQSSSKSNPPPVKADGNSSDPHSAFDRDKLHDTGTKLGESAKAFGSAASRAAKASMLQAEITKINTVNLPRAYAKLGEAVHERDEIRKQFPEIAARISEMISKNASLHSAEQDSEESKSFTQKAKALAGAAKAKGHKVILDRQLRKHFGELGKLVIESGSFAGAPVELVQAVQENLQKLESLGSDLAVQKAELTEQGGKSYSGLIAAAKNYPKASIAVGILAMLLAAGLIGSMMNLGSTGTPSGKDYVYDFSKVDYESIPNGTQREKRFKPYGNPSEGMWMEQDGYLEKNKTFVAHGQFTIWNQKNKQSKSISGWNFHGKIHGMRYAYSENGDIEAEMQYVDGELNGIVKSWYPDGQLALESRYVDGKLHGLERKWFGNGTVKTECNYNMGVCDGPFLHHGLNGLQEGQYKNGIPVGTWTFEFRSMNNYTMQVDDKPWNGSTKADLIAKMAYYNLYENSDSKIFPRADKGFLVVNYLGQLRSLFGEPSSEIATEGGHVLDWVFYASDGAIGFKLKTNSGSTWTVDVVRMTR